LQADYGRLALVNDPDELADLRGRVNCCTVLEAAGWQIDKTESTARNPKYRDGGAGIVVVRHDGRGFFAPLAGSSGDVIELAKLVWGLNLGAARQRLRPLAGVAPKHTPISRSLPRATPFDAAANWQAGRVLQPGTQGWRYLEMQRGVPKHVISRAVAAGNLREGIYGTVWAMHQDDGGNPIGWEMRGPTYKGFVRDGHKSLWRTGNRDAERLIITEGFIDALSLGTLDGWRHDTCYASTGGGWTHEAETQLRRNLTQGVQLIAAFDKGQGGDLLTARL